MNTPANFEEAMKRLEEITEIMQQSNVSLEQALKYYEEGITLMSFCQKKLAQVQQKIKILNDKSAQLEDFTFDEP
ncbi:MAG: exodeoxyribonuclease VII small subunit [Francisella sp.]|jgi:exodeoxyribonuclease VII, small subunit|nr:MAG: exodeoxyribonuclease VII small subunit [Francisella sp.]